MAARSEAPARGKGGGKGGRRLAAAALAMKLRGPTVLETERKATEGLHKGFGAAYLAKFGYAKGKGLGKDEQGIAEALRVKKREDQRGVGTDAQAYDWGAKWWEGVFNSAAKGIKAKKKKKASSGSGSDSSDDDSDSESSGSDSDSDDDSSDSDGDSDSDSDSDADDGARIAGMHADGTTATKALRRPPSTPRWRRQAAVDRTLRRARGQDGAHPRDGGARSRAGRGALGRAGSSRQRRRGRAARHAGALRGGGGRCRT